MITLVERRPWHRCMIAGSQVLLADDVNQSEQLEAWVTTVADLTIYGTPALAQGQAVEVDVVDLIAGEMNVQYAGILNNELARSFPNRVSWRCLGPLHRLRRAPGSDHDVAGKTDGQAVKYLLDQCNVAYDPADIQDAGYVLGARMPVYWKAEEPAWSLLKELDAVFGMSTLEIGAGRVVRFAYDRVPDAGRISRTFTRGVDATFFANDRDRYDLDAVKNLWHISGASWQGDDKCTYTIWAKAAGSNAAFESTNVRVQGQSFSSDLIQSEDLAAKVAERMMRWWNRQPDTLTIQTRNDPTVHPGDVVGVVDAMYGIDITPAAAPYLVLVVDRRGHDMTLTCVGGPAGNTGAITHGVEKRCSDAGSFGGASFPGFGFDFPPIGGGLWIPWAPYDCHLHGAPGGPDMCPPECSDPGAPGGCSETATINGQAVAVNTDWRMTGVVTLTSSTQQLKVGVNAYEGVYQLRLAGAGIYLLDDGPKQQYELKTPVKDDHLYGEVVVGTPYTWTLQWSHSGKIITMLLTDGTTTWCEKVEMPYSSMQFATAFLTTTGAPTRSGESFKYDCGASPDVEGCVTPDAANWHEVRGSLSYGVGELTLDDMSGHPEAHFILDPGGISSSGTAFNPPAAIKVVGHVQISGAGGAGDAPIISIQMQERAGSMNFAAFQAEGHPDFDAAYFYLYGYEGSFSQTEVAMADVLAGYDVELLFDPVGGALTMNVNHGEWTDSVPLGDFTDAELAITGAAGSALTCDFTGLSVCYFPNVAANLTGGDWTTGDNSPWGPTEAGTWSWDGTNGHVSVATPVSPYSGWGAQSSIRTAVPATADAWTAVVVGTVSTTNPAFLFEVIDDTGGTAFSQKATMMFGTPGHEETNFGAGSASDYSAPTGAIALTAGDQFKMRFVKSGDVVSGVIEQPPGAVVYSQTFTATDWAANATGSNLLVNVMAWNEGVSGPADISYVALENNS